jgi:hypothetical protein
MMLASPMTDDEASVTQIYMHPREAVRRLAQAGVVHGLDDTGLDQLRQECWDGSEDQLEEAGLLGILTFYYETVERGAKDGFVWHAGEFWHDTDDVVAELSRALGDETPIFRQAEMRERGGAAHLTLERDDGERLSVEASSLADVVDVYNAELKRRGHARRFIRLETAGDWQMFVALDLRMANRLAVEGTLPVRSLDALEELE